LSYGTTGNSNIGSSAFAYYSTGYNYVFNNTNNIGVYPSQLNNDNLTWETVKEFNVGIDFQILEERISGSFDYFNKTIEDLLSFRPLPTTSVVSSIADNVGKTRSTGWEIGLQTRNFVSESSGGFEWTTEFTLSHYYDSWVERSPESLKH
jgi:outer membrane receptor protein involved in Fe transport